MDFIGIILTFLSTTLITISRVVKDDKRNTRNYLVYLGLCVSAGAVFATYHNVQHQKQKLKDSQEENTKFKSEIQDLKLKLFGLSGQISEATSSLLQRDDAGSIEIAERLKATSGEILSANYNTNSIISSVLKEQNDSMMLALAKTVIIMRQSLTTTENNLKAHVQQSENSTKELINVCETNLKLHVNEVEEKLEDKMESSQQSMKEEYITAENRLKTTLNAQIAKMNTKLEELAEEDSTE